jgi:tRNA(Ile)-lysidine synthase
LCNSLAVPYKSSNIIVEQGTGLSLEEQARQARYRALRDDLQDEEILLVAHHGNDQMETVLLQLLRGAGPPGLAAMPGLATFGKGWLCRPLLDQTRGELEAYAISAGLSWQEDPSNCDITFGRNYLRHEVIPAITERWPSASITIARSARHCAEAAELIDDLAALDLVELRDGDRLSTRGLNRLSISRQRNVVRYWLKSVGYSVPDSRRLQSILDNVVQAADDATPEVKWADVVVRRYRHRLYVMKKDDSGARPAETDPTIWNTSLPLSLADGCGSLVMERCQAKSGEPVLDWQRLCGRDLIVRRRKGGERVRIAGQSISKPLKKMLQEAGIVPWMRDRIPLIYDGDELVAVGDMWICADAVADDTAEAAQLRWSNRPAIF